MSRDEASSKGDDRAGAAAGPDLAFAHSDTIDGVLAALQVGREGLNPAEAEARLRRYGPNALPHAPPASLLQVVLRQFASPLIYILVVAAAVAAAMGDLEDAAFIAVVLALNAAIGAVQEYRAQQSAGALASLVSARARVVRGRDEYEIDAEEVVPGDVVVIESGAKIPADLRLLSGSVEVDESLLTGESVPVPKRADAVVGREAPLGDRTTMAFAGTMATRGRAYGVATATGAQTELGEIAASLSSAETAKPPLLQRMERFTRKVAISVAGAVAILGGVMLLRGEPIQVVFLGAVSLAVSVIPEGLPVAMTVALAIAVRRMSRRRVIARRLAAVEALGSCTLIASDKTGTLTMNELTVQRVLLPSSPPIEVTGEGTSPNGSLLIPPDRIDAERRARRTERLRAAIALCNDATLAKSGDSWTSHGDSVDVALLVLAEKLGLSRAAAESDAPRYAALPFEAERQYAATLNKTPDGLTLHVKGAGERVLPMCSHMATLAGDVPIDRAALEAEANKLAADGYRVLAVATGPSRLRKDGEIDPESLSGLVLLGFLAMIDPLRPEVPAAIKACRVAGIQVAMVTGDHPVTALAIASKLGLATSRDQVVTGPALTKASDLGRDAFDEAIRHSLVFARVEPQQKLEIVQGMIRSGHFVAVTGDGANDAPAMRAAHIGVAMGKRGTDVAKETGELIIADDNFASIVAGVEEGRIAYSNVRKVIFLLVSSGAAELVLFTLSIATGLPLPLFPAQILWLNLVTNGIQDVALAFEPGEGGELERPPRSPKEPIFERLMLERTFLSALVMGGVSFFSFRWMLEQGVAVEEARNILLLLLVLFENVQAGNARSEHRSLFSLGPLRNPLLLVGTVVAQLLHIAAMHLPGLSDVLHVRPVSFDVWLTLLVLALSLFAVMEAHKALRKIV